MVMVGSPGYTQRLGTSTTAFAGEPAQHSLEPGGSLLVERGPTGRIDVENGHERAGPIEYRDDDLRLGARVARDVAWKPFDVGNDDGALLSRSRSAHAAAKGDLEATDCSLIRTHAQQSRPNHAIEARPEMRECMVKQSAHRGHSRDVVIDSGQHADQVCVQLRVRAILWFVTKIQGRFSHFYLDTIDANCKSMSKRPRPCTRMPTPAPIAAAFRAKILPHKPRTHPIPMNPASKPTFIHSSRSTRAAPEMSRMCNPCHSSAAIDPIAMPHNAICSAKCERSVERTRRMVIIATTVVAASTDSAAHSRSRNRCCCSARRNVSDHTLRMLVSRRRTRKCRLVPRRNRFHLRGVQRTRGCGDSLRCRQRRWQGVPEHNSERRAARCADAIERRLEIGEACVPDPRAQDRVRDRKSTGYACHGLFDRGNDDDRFVVTRQPRCLAPK